MLTPLGRTALDELTLREGSQRMSFPDGVVRDETVADALADLRGER